MHQKVSFMDFDAEQRLEIILRCRDNKEQSLLMERKIVSLPIFLSLKFQCIENPGHTRIIIVSRVDFVMGHVKIIQDCLKCEESKKGSKEKPKEKCKGKMNLIGVN